MTCCAGIESLGILQDLQRRSSRLTAQADAARQPEAIGNAACSLTRCTQVASDSGQAPGDSVGKPPLFYVWRCWEISELPADSISWLTPRRAACRRSRAGTSCSAAHGCIPNPILHDMAFSAATGQPSPTIGHSSLMGTDLREAGKFVLHHPDHPQCKRRNRK